MNEILPQILQGIGVIVGAALAYLIKLLIAKIKNDSLKANIEQVLEAATAKVQDEFVDWKKKDKTFDKDARELAVNKAVATAVDLAPAKLKPIIENMPIDQIRGYIQNILAKRAK